MTRRFGYVAAACSLAACLAALRVAEAAEPAVVRAAPIGVVGVEPKPNARAGQYRVRLRVTGLPVDSAMNLQFDGVREDDNEYEAAVSLLTVDNVNLDGPGRLFHDDASYGPVYSGGCERGGRQFPAGYRNPAQVALPAGATTDLLVDVTTLPGLVGSGPPRLTVRATPQYPMTIDWDRPDYWSGDALPSSGSREPEFEVRVPLPKQVGLPRPDGVSLAVRRLRGGDVIAKGNLRSYRRGVRVGFVGLRTYADRQPSLGNARGTLADMSAALAPVGRKLGRLNGYELESFGTTRTGRGGEFRVRLKAPRNTVLIARTADGPKRVAAGASCARPVR